MKGTTALLFFVFVCTFIAVCKGACEATSCSECVNTVPQLAVTCHWCVSKGGCYNIFDFPDPNKCVDDVSVAPSCPSMWHAFLRSMPYSTSTYSTSTSSSSYTSSSGGSYSSSSYSSSSYPSSSSSSSSGYTGGSSGSSDTSGSSTSSSGTSSNGGGGAEAGTFIAFYLLTLVLVIIIYGCSSCAVSPIVERHKNRTTILDFSAFPDGLDVQTTVHQSAGPSLIWADVNIRVPKMGELVGLIFWYVFGIVMSIFASVSWVFIPVLLCMFIPGAIYIIAGLKQLIGKQHYTCIYWLSSSGATIMRKGRWCGGSYATSNFRFCDMKDLHSCSSAFGLGNVYFAKTWNLQQQLNNEAPGNPSHTRFSHYDRQGNRYVYKKVSIGFENIVRFTEVESIIRENMDKCYGPGAQMTVLVGGSSVLTVGPTVGVISQTQPLVQQQQPMFVQQQPMVVQQQPIVMQQQPIVMQQQPMVMQQQPIVMQQQPMVMQQQPIVMQQQPMVMQQQPMVMQQQPMQQAQPYVYQQPQFQQQPTQQFQQQPVQQQFQQQPTQQQFQQQPMQFQQPIMQQPMPIQQTPTSPPM